MGVESGSVIFYTNDEPVCSVNVRTTHAPRTVQMLHKHQCTPSEFAAKELYKLYCRQGCVYVCVGGERREVHLNKI